MRRLLALVSLAVGLLLVGASAASAHDALQSTSPADGATVDRLPQQVTLTFAEQPLALGLQILVKGPTGEVAQGQPTIDGSVVTQRLSPQAPAGTYVVTYRVTSSDGHPISGTFTFHATVGLDGSSAGASAAATTTATGPATPTQDVPAARQAPDTPAQTPAETPSFVPVMLTVAGVVIVAAMIAAIWLVSRRRAANPSQPGQPGQPPKPSGPASRE